MQHVVLGKRPQLVKFIVVVGLYANHHAIRHALRTHIPVTGVINIGFRPLVIIYLAVVVSLEVVVPQLVQFALDVAFRLA